MIQLEITEILNTKLITRFLWLTSVVEENTRPDGIRNPAGQTALHERDELVRAAQMPRCYERSLLELHEMSKTEGADHEPL